jgi:hypothetical protein
MRMARYQRLRGNSTVSAQRYCALAPSSLFMKHARRYEDEVGVSRERASRESGQTRGRWG